MKKIVLGLTVFFYASGAFAMHTQLRSGPRFGMSYLFVPSDPGSKVEITKETDIQKESSESDANVIVLDPSVISLLGYHVDYTFYPEGSPLNPMFQFDVIGGAIEHQLFYPTLVGATGFRHDCGIELAFGGSYAPRTMMSIISVGYNIELGELIIPVNVAAGISNEVSSVTILTGWNIF
jgi:hypothetical protein